MAHIFYQITAAMMCGAKLIVGDNTRTEAIGETIRRGRITHIDAAPSFYTACLAATDLRGEDLRSVRYITSCGAPLADKVAVEFRHRFGREILQRYGLTETGPVLINYDENPRKRGSLGTAAPGCEIQLRGQDHERDDEGEILVRCKGLFSGYFSPWTSQNDTLNNGWFCTGDLARKDADGFYWMTGRTKSIINVGAVKVFPGELEAILLSHQNIEEAHVFPAEDARFGEVPHAQVILRPGSSASEQDLLRYVNRSLSVFKAVRRIEIVGQISKTLTGKIKRHERSQTR